MADFNFYLNRQGVRGQQGEQGPQGFSPIITVATNTLSEYVLQIQTQNNTFLTANLREHKEDLGGTYIRYNRETGVMYAGAPDMGGIGQYGMVSFASATDIQEDDESTVVSPANVNDMIDARDYDGAIAAVDDKADTNADNIATNTGNISTLQGQMSGVLANYVTTNSNQTITARKIFEQFRTNKIRTADGITYINTAGAAPNLDVEIGSQNNTRDISLTSERKVDIISPSVNIRRNNQTYSNIDSGNISGYLPVVPTKTSDLTNDSGFITSADLPIVGNGTITFTQGGVTKGTITTNQSGNATIALDAGGSSLTEGNGIDITNNEISVKVDGTTVDFDSSGNLTVIGGGSAPTNMVTTDTTQTITGYKIVTSNGGIKLNDASIYDSYGDLLVSSSLMAMTNYLGNANRATQLLGSTVTDGNGNTYLTSGNISTNAYIAALEARIAALEANINGGSAANA